MSAEANKATIQRVFAEAVNGGEMAIIAAVFAPDLIDHSADPGQLPGVAGIIASVQTMRRTFPDLTVTVETLVSDDDHVASRETWTGTHANTGLRSTGTVLHLFAFREGQIVEEWSVGWNWLPIEGLIPG